MDNSNNNYHKSLSQPIAENNSNSNNNDDKDNNINGLKILENNSNRLLNIILNSQIGVSEIKLKRKVTELSEQTEILKKLQIEKSSIINQIQIESNRLKYLESLEKNNLLIANNSNSDSNSSSNSNPKQHQKQKKREQDEQTIENELLESICNLKEKLFNLSTSRTEQQNLFNRIYQSKLIEHLTSTSNSTAISKNNSSNNNNNNIIVSNKTATNDNNNNSNNSTDNNENKIIKLSKIRDECIERCLKTMNQIDLNNNEISKIRKQRIEEMKLNREVYSALKSKLDESKSKTEKEQKNYEILKNKTILLGFIVQSLVYESGIDWIKDQEISQFFDNIDNFGEDIDGNGDINNEDINNENKDNFIH